jgi:hypothetical protein
LLRIKPKLHDRGYVDSCRLAPRVLLNYLALVAAGAFLISYNFFAMLLRGGGGGAGAGARDPVVAMPAWMREAAGGEARRRPFHVALTATDAAYSRWQCRVMYYWYKRMQALPGGEAMGIPTFVIDPLPAG